MSERWKVVPTPSGSFGKDWCEILTEGNMPVVTVGSYESTRHGETETRCGVRIDAGHALLIAAAPQLRDALQDALQYLVGSAYKKAVEALLAAGETKLK